MTSEYAEMLPAGETPKTPAAGPHREQATGQDELSSSADPQPLATSDGREAAPVEGVALVASGSATSQPASRPILPPWVRSRQALADALAWSVRHHAHVLAFHGLRLPLYWLRLSAGSPVGLGRVIRQAYRWSTDSDGAAVRSSLTATGTDAADFVRLTQQRREMVRARLLLAGVVISGFTLAGWTLATTATVPALVAVGVVLSAVLGLAGRSPDRPVTSRAVDSEAIPKLTVDLILTALGSLGIGELNKSIRTGGDSAVRFPSPIVRDGPGFRADIDLPPGVTAGDVIERRDRLASGLRRPVGCVWPEGDHDTHAGRLILWVGDRPMAKAKPVPWPLTKAGRVDLFAPFPVGVDPRGRPVTVTLMFVSMVIGAIPRMGKSFFLRLVLLAASLDPGVQLRVYDLKGGADFLPLEGVAHRFRIGDDPDDISYLLADLRDLAADMPRRYRTVRGLPRTVCPEGKISPELAVRRDLGLFPIVLALDECQRAFEHPTHGGEIETIVTDLAKRGPAVGIIVILATQRPDAKSLPTGISANAILRFCLKVAGQLENDMVLGTSAYKNGVRATMFSRSDKGVGYLSGEGEEPTITRAAYIDGPTAESIALRARAARLAAGLLTGHAAGLEPEPDASTASVLDHLAAIWPADDDKVWWDDLAERLSGTFPGLYGTWTGEQVTAAVRSHGLKSIQIKRTIDGRQYNRRGLHRQALAEALSDRDVDYQWPEYVAPENPWAEVARPSAGRSSGPTDDPVDVATSGQATGY